MHALKSLEDLSISRANLLGSIMRGKARGVVNSTSWPASALYQSTIQEFACVGEMFLL